METHKPLIWKQELGPLEFTVELEAPVRGAYQAPYGHTIEVAVGSTVKSWTAAALGFPRVASLWCRAGVEREKNLGRPAPANA